MTTYCVVCRVPLSRLPHAARTINFFVSAPSAERAMAAAAAENANYRVLGVEPFNQMTEFRQAA